MRHTRFHVVLIAVRFSLLSGVFFVFPSLNKSQNTPPPGYVTPILRLEKPKYLLGEAIRFWVGVEPKNSSPIPQEAWKPCSLEITKPDGSIETQSIGWPKDGMHDHGWSGGWGFGDSQTGSYVLALECGGEKTEPVELVVEKISLSDQIKAEFHFERSGMIGMATPVSIALTVQNNSAHTIQFPQRGAMIEGISIRVIRAESAFQSDFFFPWQKLATSNTLPDTYTWDVASDIPSVVLRPGEHFEQRFALEDAYSFDQPGNYEVTFSTVLSVLVGDAGGPFAEICPIRLPVVATEKFTVTSESETLLAPVARERLAGRRVSLNSGLSSLGLLASY